MSDWIVVVLDPISVPLFRYLVPVSPLQNLIGGRRSAGLSGAWLAGFAGRWRLPSLGLPWLSSGLAGPAGLLGLSWPAGFAGQLAGPSLNRPLCAAGHIKRQFDTGQNGLWRWLNREVDGYRLGVLERYQVPVSVGGFNRSAHIGFAIGNRCNAVAVLRNYRGVWIVVGEGGRRHYKIIRHRVSVLVKAEKRSDCDLIRIGEGKRSCDWRHFFFSSGG
jgi:hypothetical protein